VRPLEGLTAAEDWGPVGQVGNTRHAPCALQGTIQPRRAAFSSSIDALNCSCELAVNYYFGLRELSLIQLLFNTTRKPSGTPSTGASHGRRHRMAVMIA
jgi:hypothetical protein